MRIAVYVEGQTELIFIREFLRKWYNYDSSKLGFRCYRLQSEQMCKTEFSFGNNSSERFYIIVNAGGDKKALSKALDNAQNHRDLGFDRVLVLRDMYSEQYKEAQPEQVIDDNIIKHFIVDAQDSIKDKKFNGFVHCHFAIMEVEAWLLGMGWYLQKVDKSLTQDCLLKELKFDLEADPETTVYHPAQRLTDIYEHVGKIYDKHKHDVNSIMSHFDKTDFQLLLDLDKCASFNAFIGNLTN
ncbi:MAG: DUF4276 family protein [Muribaculaceae bacterium]|nr:DUF4276 family protein [Muribaculaceae bacterium]